MTINLASTVSGVKGTERKRTTVASKIAFAIAAGTTGVVGSPASDGFFVGPIDEVDRDIRQVRELEDRLALTIDARHRGAVEAKTVVDTSGQT